MEEIPIGRFIRRARQRKRLTQMAFAARIGVSKSSVANWESGLHFPQRHLGAIEEVLEISLAAYEPERVAS
jgi:transcriptional regulator with XRE-family HTH domain